MAAFAVKHLSFVSDSPLDKDAALTRARTSHGPGNETGKLPPSRRPGLASNVEFADLEPKWLAAIDAATD